jgi:hypothetical protein
MGGIMNVGKPIVWGTAIGLVASGMAAVLAWFCVPPRQLPDVQLDNSLIAEIDDYIRMPAGARPEGEYIRFYSIAKPKTEDDLPFTTLIEPPRVPWGARVVLGVFVQRGTGDLWGIKGPPRAVIAPDSKQLPSPVHGGCSVVNVVVDLQTAQTLGSWCNFDDRPLDQRTSVLRAR